MKTHGTEIGPLEFRLMGLRWGYNESTETETVVLDLVPTGPYLETVFTLELPIEAAKAVTVGQLFSVAVSS